ncbi:hypothetical protein Droror1_Dr00007807 [Drosera rotundifolia]
MSLAPNNLKYGTLTEHSRSGSKSSVFDSRKEIWFIEQRTSSCGGWVATALEAVRRMGGDEGWAATTTGKELWVSLVEEGRREIGSVRNNLSGVIVFNLSGRNNLKRWIAPNRTDDMGSTTSTLPVTPALSLKKHRRSLSQPRRRLLS